MEVAIDYSMIDFVNEHGFEVHECWDFIESFAVQVVSHKCESFNNKTTNNTNNIYDNIPLNLQTKEGIDHNDSMNEVLLGYAQENEPITFIDYFDNNEESESDDTDVDIDHLPDIQDNKHMDHIFDLENEIEETLASALDLLPEFCSIPIPIEDDTPIQSRSSRNNIINTNNNNIDKCLRILRRIDIDRIHDYDAQQNQVIDKISEMRHIIESLQIKIGNNNEGFVYNNYSCEYSVDPHNEDDNEGEDVDQELLRMNGNITLMGEGHITC